MLSVIDETMKEVVKYDIFNRTARLRMTRFHSFSWEYDSWVNSSLSVLIHAFTTKHHGSCQYLFHLTVVGQSQGYPVVTLIKWRGIATASQQMKLASLDIDSWRPLNAPWSGQQLTISPRTKRLCLLEVVPPITGWRASPVLSAMQEPIPDFF